MFASLKNIGAVDVTSVFLSTLLVNGGLTPAILFHNGGKQRHIVLQLFAS
jgi:hypothetical protein